MLPELGAVDISTGRLGGGRGREGGGGGGGGGGGSPGVDVSAGHLGNIEFFDFILRTVHYQLGSIKK